MSSTITPDDIRWLPPTTALVDGKHCPVCGHASGHAPVLDVPAMAPPYLLLTLLKCAKCASMFYDPQGVRRFQRPRPGIADDVRRASVVEGFAGVWESIWPVLADQVSGPRTLLEVGCGFGFTLDFWRRCNGGEAVGVEIAEYGATGAALLDVTIHRQFLAGTVRRLPIVLLTSFTHAKWSSTFLTRQPLLRCWRGGWPKMVSS